MSLEFVGAYTPIHHQYFQMVDMLIHHWKRTMDGLNPYAISYVPSTRIDTEDRVCTKKMNDNNVESFNKGHDNDATASTKWNMCRTKEGRGCNNNNKYKKERNNKVFGNRFSRLQELVQDNQEDMDMLEKAVDETKYITINKVEEEVNTNNTYNVDAVDMNTLEAEIQKHVESDRNDNNKNNDASDKKENIEQDSESECTDSDCVSERDEDHYQSEGEVAIRREHVDLEGYVLEIEEELRKAQNTSYYNALFNYLNMQQKEHQCQWSNDKIKELIKDWKMERLMVVEIRKNDEEQIQSFAAETNSVILELKRKIYKMEHYKTVDYEYENNKEKG